MSECNNGNKQTASEWANGVANNGWYILFCNTCSVVSLILTFIFDDIICRIIFGSITCLFACALVGYLFYRVFAIKRAKLNLEASYVGKNKKVFDYIQAYQHDLLDFSSFVNNQNNINVHTFKDKAALLCNRIEQILTSALGTKDRVSVCVKCLKTETILNNDVDNWEIYTFARSSSTQATRLEYDRKDREPDKIAGNTDFEVIVSDDERFKSFNCFYCGDLDTYPEIFRKKYTKEFKKSHSNPPYKSTIIVPIRMISDNISPMLQKQACSSKYYHVIGFLCIDSEEKFIKTPGDYRYSTFKNSVSVVRAIGDSLYPFFESYLTKELSRNGDSGVVPATAE